MSYKVETYNNIVRRYNYLLENKIVESKCPDIPHQQLREFLVRNYHELKQSNKKLFDLDLELGLKLYQYLKNSEFFDPIVESKADFWSTIAVFDIPDLIDDRFGLKSKEHYYKKNVRIYPYTLYWFIHLIWQGSVEETRDLVKDTFNTDEILSFSERPTKIGINLEFYRKLAHKFATCIKENNNSKLIKLKNGDTVNIVRYIFTLNTSKLSITRPEIYPGGIDGYINMLFSSLEK